MAIQKWPYDLKRVKKIFQTTKGPKAYEKIRKYLEEEVLPLKKNLSVAKQQERKEKLHMAFEAAVQNARGRSWIQPHHNAKRRESMWSEKKKRLFAELFEGGASVEEFALHLAFKGDLPKDKDARDWVHNVASSLDCDRQKRKEAIAKQGEEAKMILKPDEQEALTKLVTNKRIVTAANLTEALKRSLKETQQLLCRLVQNGVLCVCRNEAKEKIYFATIAGVYTDKEVFTLLPARVRGRLDREILKRVAEEEQGHRSRTAFRTFGKRLGLADQLTDQYLSYLVTQQAIVLRGQAFARQKALNVRDFSPETFARIVALAAENRERAEENLKELEDKRPDFSKLSLDAMIRYQEEDLTNKVAPPMTFDRPLRIAYINLALIGHQATDYGYLLAKVDEIRTRIPERKPDLVVLHGLFSGPYLHIQVNRKKTLVERLRKMSAQISWMGKTLETLGLPWIYVLGSAEDQLIVREYAMKATFEDLRLGGLGLSAEVMQNVARQQKVMTLAEYEKNERLEQHVIYPYILRTMKPLRNAQEMLEQFGIEEPERKLVARAGKALRHKRPLDPDALRVLDIVRLQDTSNERVVESLRLKYPGLSLKVASYITQSDSAIYKEPLKHLREYIRKAFTSGEPLEDIPDVMVVCNDGVFGMAFIPPGLFGPSKRTGTFAITLPGLQNDEQVKNLGAYHGDVKQDRVAKAKKRDRIVRPGTIEHEGTAEHFYLTVDNSKFLSIRKNWKGPTERSKIAMVNDVQIGLDQAWVSLMIHYMDYALCHEGADRLWLMGDLVNGVNYLGAMSHNTKANLPGIGQQLKALQYILKGFWNRGCSPKLQQVRIADGNHEWNSPAKTHFADIRHLQVIHDVGELMLPEVDWRYCTKIKIGNRGVSVFNPMGTDTFCGLRFAYSHLWSGKRMQGAIPTGEQKSWATAHGARDIDWMVAGHQASAYMEQLGDKIHMVIPGFEDPTDFTISMHQAQNVMASIIHVSTDVHEPPRIEFLTRAFLENYKPVSPLLRGKTADDLVAEALEHAHKASSVE